MVIYWKTLTLSSCSCVRGFSTNGIDSFEGRYSVWYFSGKIVGCGAVVTGEEDWEVVVTSEEEWAFAFMVECG